MKREAAIWIAILFTNLFTIFLTRYVQQYLHVGKTKLALTGVIKIEKGGNSHFIPAYKEIQK